MCPVQTRVRVCSRLFVVVAILAAAASNAPAERRTGNYLIISASSYVGSAPLNEFISAKTAQGFEVMTYAVPSGTSRTTIKSYILDLWGTADAPDYILLVGDTDGSSSTSATIPHWSGGGSKVCATDLPYGCMGAGDDWYPDIAVGRFSVRTVSTLADVVEKSLFVEAGVYPDPDYPLRGAFLANPGTQGMAEPTHDWVIDNYFVPNGYEGIKLYSAQGANTQSVTNAINDGCLWAVYYGHSGSSGWWDPSFGQGNVQALSNSGLYGVVFSFSCNVGAYHYDECFGETWHRVADRGAAAVIFPSDYIYWGSQDAWLPSTVLEHSFFRAFFEDDIWEVGPAWQAGLYHFLADYTGSTDIKRNFFELYNLMGDPSLLLPGGVGFRLYASPDSQDLCSPPVNQAVYTIEVEQLGDFTEPVTLDTSGEPLGSTIDFSLNSLPPPFTTVMTVGNLTGVSPDSYVINIQGTASSASQNTTVELSLSGGVPGAVALLSPPDGASDAPRSPTLTWQPATDVVDYNLEIATDPGFAYIVHNATLTDTSYTVPFNLEPLTEYFWHVRANNGCGESGWSSARSFTTLDQADSFTEEFGSFDLEYFTVVFYPDGTGDHYGVCGDEAAGFPTDPAGGSNISLGDDDSEHLYLGAGQSVSLHGISYEEFYVGSNGYITFGAGDNDYTQSLADHFNLPRISALFNDLNPSAGGSVSWKQLADRAAITFQNVPNYGSSNSNSYQIEMFFDGLIQITWLNIDAGSAIAGLSAGGGIPDDYLESDLSAVSPCVWEAPPTAEDDNVSTPVNTPLMITLIATDEGQPNPPGALTYIVESLPVAGALRDAGTVLIESVPYTLLAGGDQVEYTPDSWYVGPDSFTFKANDGGTPPSGGDSNTALVAIDVTPPAPELVYDFPLDSDPGWSTQAQWAFGPPTGGGSHYGDPGAGHTGANVYGYNLAGDYTSNMPEYHLATSALDCTYLQEVELSFWKWLGVESSEFDHAAVEVSNDGSFWATLWENPPSVTSDNQWSQASFDISDIADGRPTVYIRWTMGTTDGTVTYPGWNIDDVEIWAVNLTPDCPGDLDGDNDVDLGDLSQLLAHYGITSGASYEDGDLDGDGDVDLGDLSALLAVYGTTCP